MTGYFVRRFLLIIPTFLGITLAVFVVMQFVPGGPVERQIMRLQMSAMSEGGAGVGGDQVALSRVDLPGAHRVHPELHRLCAAGSLEGGPARIEVRLLQQR